MTGKRTDDNASTREKGFGGLLQMQLDVPVVCVRLVLSGQDQNLDLDQDQVESAFGFNSFS